MAQDKREPEQQLPKTGEEIPVPTREAVFRGLRKAARISPRADLRSSDWNSARSSERWLYRQTYSFKYDCNHLRETA
jgi:hypothetical protein